MPGGSVALAAHQEEGTAAGSVEEMAQPGQAVGEEEEGEDGPRNAVGAVAAEVAAAAERDGGAGGAAIAAAADVAAGRAAAAVAANGAEGGGAAIGKGSEVVADDGQRAAVGRMADEI